MSKMKFNVKLQGLEVSFEGERRDVPQAATAIGRHVGQIVNAALQPENEQLPLPQLEGGASASPRRRRRSERTTADAGAKAIVWTHDPSRWGMPRQSWSASNKAMWLLFVANEAAGVKEMSSAEITCTFESMFREAKISNHVPRDLRREKQAGRVVETPDGHWFLTQQGIDYVKKVIASDLSASAA
jgi:hypothetical protein